MALVNGLAGISLFLMFCLALLNIYWILGGKWAVDPAQTKGVQENWFQAGTVIGLLLASVLLANQLGWFEVMPIFVGRWGIWIGATLFLSRAIGDFRYTGLFKKSRQGFFRRLDTWLLSPVFFFQALVFGWVAHLPQP